MGLKDLRLAKGYSRTELAKVSGIRYQKIRDIEVGIIKPENITLKTALKLAQALDCQPEDLTKPDKEESERPSSNALPWTVLTMTRGAKTSIKLSLTPTKALRASTERTSIWSLKSLTPQSET